MELPEEDKDPEKDEIGLLQVCLYGIQDAARAWQNLLAEHLKDLGFVRGIGHPCVFYHPTWGVKALVHGDDYVSSGPEAGLDKLRHALVDRFEIRNSNILGHGPSDEQEGKVLNRIVRAAPEGWELEADPQTRRVADSRVKNGGY